MAGDCAVALYIAANRNAVAGDDEAIAGGDRSARRHQRRGRDLERRGELDQRNVSGDAMAQHCIDVEVGMARNGREIFERGLPRAIEFHQLVVGARQHAMRRREHEIARKRHARAECGL